MNENTISVAKPGILADRDLDDLQNTFNAMRQAKWRTQVQLDGMSKEEFVGNVHRDTREFLKEEGIPEPEKIFSVGSGGEKGFSLCITGFGPKSEQNAVGISHILNNYQHVLSGYRAMKAELGRLGKMDELVKP